ncbi:MAG: molecular chaperone TorD family protein [Betaproteobacteria bacterium]|nr:molecular chaperone TorD family protein [Betaproteobacteria bacterium]
MIQVQRNVQRQAVAAAPTPADARAIGLRGQLVLYDLLRRLFFSGPSPDLIQAISAVDRTSLGLPKHLDNDLGKMQEVVDANLERRESWSESLLVEFTRLLVGPGETPVVPYGSFYLSPTRNLMTEETLAVRAFYLGAGMAVQNLNQVPDDHLGIELNFCIGLHGKRMMEHRKRAGTFLISATVSSLITIPSGCPSSRTHLIGRRPNHSSVRLPRCSKGFVLTMPNTVGQTAVRVPKFVEELSYRNT